MAPSNYTPIQRPLSSLSNRPSSSLSRPSSRAAPARPASSLTVRPSSSASVRTQSRLSHGRPHSRSNARSRIMPHCQALVGQVTGMDATSDEYNDAVDTAVRRLETTTISKPSASVDIGVIDRSISGHALKARLNLQDKLAEALEHCYKKLKDQMERSENDLDATVVSNKLPDHLQLLLALSEPPNAPTLAFADSYLEEVKNPTPSTPPLTWADILADEPFEGEHWEGILDYDKDEWDTTPSLSPLDSDDLALDDDDSLASDYLLEYDEPEPVSPHLVRQSEISRPPYTDEHVRSFEHLKYRQYWHNEWTSDADPSRPFDLGDPSTLGPTIDRAVAERTRAARLAQNMLPTQKYINEEDMVREVLIAMQGRDNVVFKWDNGAIQTTESTPRLIHLSLQSQESILHSVGKTATTLQHLRRFVAYIFSQSANRIASEQVQIIKPVVKIPHTKTAEAFAEAVDYEIRKFEGWCAAREEAMLDASIGASEEPLVVSLLNTEQDIRRVYDDSFEVLLTIVRDVFAYPDVAPRHRHRRSSATLTSALLDTLFARLQEHMERSATVTAAVLLRVFISSSEPIWGMIGKWLRDGMNVNSLADDGNPGGLDEEFFIEPSGIGMGALSMGLLDPDFWKEGYSLREAVLELDGEGGLGPSSSVVPKFLEHVAELILGTGKAIGLVRALGLPPSSHGFATWPSFAELVESDTSLDDAGAIFAVSVDSLSRVIHDQLHGPCEESGSFLAKLLNEECDLWDHVNAIEDLFLMRKGDAITHFLDVVFTKMDAEQAWTDFHFLNTAFGDVVRSNLTSGIQEWIQLSLVRLTFRGHRDKDRVVTRTVRAIDGLSVEYAVPFPLTYIFRPENIQIYSDAFVFLVQIRRAKHVLERILIRQDNSHQCLKEELKVFYAMRSRLSWFINTFLNFLTTYVLQEEIKKFHEVLKAAKSLDEVINLHDNHLEKIQDRCLLGPNADGIHRKVISILDMCLYFAGIFTAFAGDTTATHDISRASIAIKHRSRKHRRQQRNVIGFTQSLRDLDLSSDDDDDDEPGLGYLGQDTDASASMFQSIGDIEDGDLSGRVERLSKELDNSVRVIRKGVEALAAGSTEAAPAFGVLAFALEDWDL